MQEVRNGLSALVDAARSGKPQLVMKRDAPAAVVLAAEEYARMKALDEQQALSFVDHLLAIPKDDESCDRLEVAGRGAPIP